ncbi:MAG TPA: helix-turn-helix domain-containing protein, partial [Dehalococcoidia bacterium]
MPNDTEVRSGARVIRIVEMFAKERRPLSAGEIAARLNIPQTSVHRLLATLVAMRWAERKSGRLYQLGAGVLGVGSLGIGRSTLIQLA